MSVWGSMLDRSTGDAKRKEDQIIDLDFRDLYPEVLSIHPELNGMSEVVKGLNEMRKESKELGKKIKNLQRTIKIYKL